MRRPVLNRYKLERQWRRFSSNRRRVVRSRNHAAILRLHNPYAQPHRLPRRLKFNLALLGLCVGISFGILFFHPFFRIQNIAVSGTKRLTAQDITATVQSAMNYRRWFVFPGGSYIMAGVSDVRAVLMEKYPLASVTITKTFPHSLTVALQEKISTVIYDNAEIYSYLDTSGHVVELLQQVAPNEWSEYPTILAKEGQVGGVTSSTITSPSITRVHRPSVASVQKAIGEYPIVYDARNQKVELGSQVLPEKIIKGIIAWFDFFEKQTNVSFGYVEISDDRGDGVIHTAEGWEARVHLIDNMSGQTELLTHLLNEQTNRKQISYIDLRYQGRVYWK